MKMRRSWKWLDSCWTVSRFLFLNIITITSTPPWTWQSICNTVRLSANSASHDAWGDLSCLNCFSLGIFVTWNAVVSTKTVTHSSKELYSLVRITVTSATAHSNYQVMTATCISASYDNWSQLVHQTNRSLHTWGVLFYWWKFTLLWRSSISTYFRIVTVECTHMLHCQPGAGFCPCCYGRCMRHCVVSVVCVKHVICSVNRTV